MSIMMIAAIVAIVSSILIFIIASKDKSKQPDFYSAYTPEGLQIVRALEELHQNNKSLRYLGFCKIYDELFGKPEENSNGNSYLKKIGIYNYEDEPEGSLKFIAGEYFDSLQWDLEHRYRNEFSEMYNISEKEALEKFSLNIHADETIHDYVNRVDWYEEKTITTSINYNGFRYNAGQGMIFGTLNVMRNTQDYFKIIDRGSLYITNKRIIFVGKEKQENRTIKLDDILEFTLFRDGIIIGKANGKKPLIEFPPYILEPNKAPNKRDHLYRIVRALDRVISRTQMQNLTSQ